MNPLQERRALWRATNKLIAAGSFDRLAWASHVREESALSHLDPRITLEAILVQGLKAGLFDTPAAARAALAEVPPVAKVDSGFVAPRALTKAIGKARRPILKDWDEDKHPRGEGGRFGSGGGTPAATEEPRTFATLRVADDLKFHHVGFTSTVDAEGYRTDHPAFDGEKPPRDYQRTQSDAINKLPLEQREAINKWSFQYDNAIKQIDAGRSKEEVIESIRAHRAANQINSMGYPTQWPDKSPEEHYAAAAEARDNLRKAYDAMPAQPSTVYRGMAGLSEQDVDRLVGAKSLTIPSFTSTSHSSELALDFMSRTPPPGSSGDIAVLMRLDQVSGRGIEMGSEVESENEVLLARGTQFEIRDAFRTEIVDSDGNSRPAVMISAVERIAR